MGSINKEPGQSDRPGIEKGGQLPVACKGSFTPSSTSNKCENKVYALTGNMYKDSNNLMDSTSSYVNFCDDFFHLPSFELRKFIVNTNDIDPDTKFKGEYISPDDL